MINSSIPSREPYLAITAAVLAGPTIWTLHFAILYTVAQTTCALAAHNPDRIILWTGIISTAFAALVLTGLSLRPTRFSVLQWSPANRRFLVYLCRALAGLSLIAVLWVGAASLVRPSCAVPEVADPFVAQSWSVANVFMAVD